MTNHEPFKFTEDTILPATTWEKAVIKTAGIGLALSVALGSYVIAKNEYENFQHPNYDISIIDMPGDN